MLTPQTQKLVLDVSANFKDFNTQFNNLSKSLKDQFEGIAGAWSITHFFALIFERYVKSELEFRKSFSDALIDRR